jgi:PIN domain nuclease of toxin-antitoxin system
VNARRGGRLLLDTHAFIWWATRDPRLTGRAGEVIAARKTIVFLSVVTPWEMTIKHAIGRLELSESPRSLVYAQIARNGYRPLDVSLEHVLAVGELPLHHRDPFDRLLIAQARAEGLTLVSGDAVFGRYDLPVLW